MADIICPDYFLAFFFFAAGFLAAGFLATTFFTTFFFQGRFFRAGLAFFATAFFFGAATTFFGGLGPLFSIGSSQQISSAIAQPHSSSTMTESPHTSQLRTSPGLTLDIFAPSSLLMGLNYRPLFI